MQHLSLQHLKSEYVILFIIFGVLISITMGWLWFPGVVIFAGGVIPIVDGFFLRRRTSFLFFQILFLQGEDVMLISGCNILITKEENLVVELSIFLFFELLQVLVGTRPEWQKFRKKQPNFLGTQFVVFLLDLFLRAWFVLLSLVLVFLLVRFIVLLEFTVCVVNCHLSLLEFDLFPELVDGFFSVLMVEAVQPGVSVPPLVFEDEEAVFIDVSHFFFLLHVESFHLITEVLDLFLHILGECFLAVIPECLFEIFSEFLILLFFFLIEAAFLVVLPQKSSLGSVFSGLLIHLLQYIINRADSYGTQDYLMPINYFPKTQVEAAV